MSEFRMPSLGADMEAGTLTRWLVSEGDTVHRGDIVAVVETVKGAIDVEVFEDGRIERLLVEPGTEVPVGTPLALIRSAGEPAAAAKAKAQKPRGPAPSGSAATGGASVATRPRVSPAARRRARELGVDVATLETPGPVTVAEVERAAGAGPAAVPAAGSMRAAIAAAMSRSKREIPHYYLQSSVDMGAALERLSAYNATRPLPERLLPAVLLLRAAARSAARYPEINGWYRDGAHIPSPAVHAGMATALRGGGLVAPALHDTDTRPLPELMRALADLVSRARTGRLRSSEMADPTITVTSLGEQGVESVLPVIFPPQVAIVGFGTIVRRPWVVDGKVTPRPVVRVSLAADHRVSDGHRGALFLAEIGRLLENPEEP